MIVVMTKCAFNKMSLIAKKAIEEQNATFELKDIHCGCKDCQRRAMEAFKKSKGQRNIKIGQTF